MNCLKYGLIIMLFYRRCSVYHGQLAQQIVWDDNSCWISKKLCVKMRPTCFSLPKVLPLVSYVTCSLADPEDGPGGPETPTWKSQVAINIRFLRKTLVRTPSRSNWTWGVCTTFRVVSSLAVPGSIPLRMSSGKKNKHFDGVVGAVAPILNRIHNPDK